MLSVPRGPYTDKTNQARGGGTEKKEVEDEDKDEKFFVYCEDEERWRYSKKENWKGK